MFRYVFDPTARPSSSRWVEDWVVERQRSVAGVADDSGLGGETMQVQVLLDPARVAGAGLSVQGIVSALGANNGNAGGGFYSQGGQFFSCAASAASRPSTSATWSSRSGRRTGVVRDVGPVEIGHARASAIGSTTGTTPSKA